MNKEKPSVEKVKKIYLWLWHNLTRDNLGEPVPPATSYNARARRKV